MGHRGEQGERAQRGHQERHGDFEHLLNFRSAVQIRGLDDVLGDVLHKELHDEHVVGVAERGYDVHPEGVEQLEIAHEQIARDQPAADEHRDDEEDHDAALARHFPLGHDVPARNHEHQHGRHAQNGARHGNAHGVPEIELAKYVFIRLQRGLLGNDDEIILLDHFALGRKRHADDVQQRDHAADGKQRDNRVNHNLVNDVRPRHADAVALVRLALLQLGFSRHGSTSYHMPRPATLREKAFAPMISTIEMMAFSRETALPTLYCILPRPTRYTQVSMISPTLYTAEL